MSGFGEVAAALSLTIQVFDGCIKGFVLLSEAQGLGSRADILTCQLEWEHYRLSKWASIVGLFEERPFLRVPDAELVEHTLATLNQLLTDVSALKETYGLDISISEEEYEEINAPKRKLSRLISRARPDFVNDTAKVYSRRNNAWKKLWWGAVDADKFRLFLQDVRYFNKRLESLLYPLDHNSNRKIFDDTMRSIVSQDSDRTMFEALSEPLKSVNKAIAASARLKQAGLLLDVITTSAGIDANWSKINSSSYSPVKTRTKSTTTAARDIRKSMQQISGGEGHKNIEVFREVASYYEKPIILEWKYLEASTESKMKYRVANVATFLAGMEDPSFHSLRCIGYSKGSMNRYAYLFELPKPDMDILSMKPLSNLLHTPSLRPSLNNRLSVGLALAETVLQLHTTGWLHKDIRPENVLLFNHNSGSETWQTYLGGYHFARADNPLETTEDPFSRDFSELYRHPASLGQNRPSYRKHFDLYSLGCIMIELALWESLPTILWRHLGQKMLAEAHQNCNGQPISEGDLARKKPMLLEYRNSLMIEESATSILAEIDFLLGAKYRKAVSECLSYELDDGDDYDDSLEVQERTVMMLTTLCNSI